MPQRVTLPQQMMSCILCQMRARFLSEYDKFSSDPTTNAGLYKSPDRSNKKVNCKNAVKEPEKISKTT